MAEHSTIEWTDATWNPTVGCTIKSPGCKSCYAMGEAARQIRCSAALGRETHYAGTVEKAANGKYIWTGKLAIAPDHIITAPLHWRKPRMIFTNSMSDLFHEDMPEQWIDRVFAVMALAPQHTFQVLTKRSDRMRAYCSDRQRRNTVELAAEKIAPGAGAMAPKHTFAWPLPNVWLGVSAERQQEADERIPDLLATPAAVRFVSLEPLIGPIDLESAWHGENALSSECWGDCAWCEKGYPPLHNCRREESTLFEDRESSGLDWVIVGGESGPDARPMDPEWARSIRDQCAAADKLDRFFFKQWGAWHADALAYTDVGTGACPPPKMKIGKKAAGRLLDGIEHNGMPEARSA